MGFIVKGWGSGAFVVRWGIKLGFVVKRGVGGIGRFAVKARGLEVGSLGRAWGLPNWSRVRES